MRWPSWPRIVIRDLLRSHRAWLCLKLPEELQVVQEVIGEEELAINKFSDGRSVI